LSGATDVAVRSDRRTELEENPANLSAGFFVGRFREAKRAGNFPPFAFILPVAEAMPAERPRMPAGRAVVHRTATAIGPTMPTGSTTAGHGNDAGFGRRRLIQRSHRHGLGHGDGRKTDTDRKQGRSKYLHGLSFLLVPDEKMTSGQMSSVNPYQWRWRRQ
jgi:hypothetical protein